MDCPIGLDCLMPISEIPFEDNYLICENRAYCSHLANPWDIPYRYSGDTPVKILMVFVNYETHTLYQIDELQSYGWASAQKLPYRFKYIPELSKRVLVVNFDLLAFGYCRACLIAQDDDSILT